MKTQVLTNTGLKIYDQEMKGFIDKKLEDKVDAEEGKGLSTNDYNDEEKNTVAQNKEDIEDLKRQMESFETENEDIINTTASILENSKEGGLAINEIRGKSEQNSSSPTTSSIQEIKSVVLNNIKVTNGDLQPHQEKQIVFTNPIELHGIGGVYDVLTYKNITRNFIEVVFDGSSDENWAQGNGYLYTTALSEVIKIPANQDTVPNIMCSMAKAASMNTMLNNMNSVSISANGNLNIYNSYNSNVASWKTFLQSNPMTVICELTSPVIETYPKADMIALNTLTTFEGTTHIEIDSTLKPIIDVDYGISEIGATALENYNNIRINEIIATSINSGNGITYELSKSDGKIILTGSDGSTSFVEDDVAELDADFVEMSESDVQAIWNQVFV